MQIFDLETFRATPLSRDPYEHLVIPSFVKADALEKINADYPKIEHAGSFPLDHLEFGPAFQAMIDALESEEFRKAFEDKFQLDLSKRPTTITVRGRCDTHDGKIHHDSASVRQSVTSVRAIATGPGNRYGGIAKRSTAASHPPSSSRPRISGGKVLRMHHRLPERLGDRAAMLVVLRRRDC